MKNEQRKFVEGTEAEWNDCVRPVSICPCVPRHKAHWDYIQTGTFSESSGCLSARLNRGTSIDVRTPNAGEQSCSMTIERYIWGLGDPRLQRRTICNQVCHKLCMSEQMWKPFRTLRRIFVPRSTWGRLLPSNIVQKRQKFMLDGQCCSK